MCDFCSRPGDKDKPYRNNTLTAMQARFTPVELRALIAMRTRALENLIGGHMDSHRPDAPEPSQLCQCGSDRHGVGLCRGT